MAYTVLVLSERDHYIILWIKIG